MLAAYDGNTWRIVRTTEAPLPQDAPYAQRGLAIQRQPVTSVNVVEIARVFEVAIGHAALCGSCMVSARMGGLRSSVMASTPM